MREQKFTDVGEGITEGHIQKWLVKDGDTVKADQPIVQVETDKAVVSIPAPVSGNIKIISKDGTDIKVGDTLALFGTAEELAAAGGNSQNGPAGNIPAAVTKPAVQDITARPGAMAAGPPDEKREILATPSVRKLAHELGVELIAVAGTGPHGRILENDVRGASLKHAETMHSVPKFSELKEEQHGGEVQRIPMSQLRKAIAKNMELSWTIPRAAHMDLIDATALYGIVHREKSKAEKIGVKLTFLPFIIKAVIRALKENERFNSSYDKERQEIIIKRYYNIGLAAEGEDGLRVIAVKNADGKSTIQVAKEIQELGAKVKDKTITIEDMSDTTFTITNIGSLGGGFFSVPMINYPDVAILGIHLIRDMPMAIEGRVEIRKVLPVSLTFDHRVVDGAEAVRFTNAIRDYLEDPDFLEMLG